MAVKIILTVVVLLTIVLPIGSYFVAKDKSKRSFKRTLLINISTFAAAVIIATLVGFTGTAQAAEETAAAASSTGLGYIGAALAVGIACLGSGIAVGNAASAALGALSENETLFGKSLVFVGLSEGIALYGLIIAFMILGSL